MLKKLSNGFWESKWIDVVYTNLNLKIFNVEDAVFMPGQEMTQFNRMTSSFKYLRHPSIILRKRSSTDPSLIFFLGSSGYEPNQCERYISLSTGLQRDCIIASLPSKLTKLNFEHSVPSVNRGNWDIWNILPCTITDLHIDHYSCTSTSNINIGNLLPHLKLLNLSACFDSYNNSSVREKCPLYNLPHSLEILDIGGFNLDIGSMLRCHLPFMQKMMFTRISLHNYDIDRSYLAGITIPSDIGAESETGWSFYLNYHFVGDPFEFDFASLFNLFDSNRFARSVYISKSTDSVSGRSTRVEHFRVTHKRKEMDVVHNIDAVNDMERENPNKRKCLSNLN